MNEHSVSKSLKKSLIYLNFRAKKTDICINGAHCVLGRENKRETFLVFLKHCDDEEFLLFTIRKVKDSNWSSATRTF